VTQNLPDAGTTVSDRSSAPEDPTAGNLAELFAASTIGLEERSPARAALTAATPVVVADAPAGGPVYIVTDHDLARSVLVDPRIAKDPALAPPAWDRWAAALEPTASEQPSLTTLDGAAHTALRRAHAPLLSARRTAEFGPRITHIARRLLADAAAHGVVDLMADFTTRYPLTVLCDLIGVPLDRVDLAATACRGMHSDDPADVGRAMSTFAELAASALKDGQNGLATELRDALPGSTTADDLHYLIFTLLFAGQLTTDPAAGFVLARLLDGELDRSDAPAEDFVRDVLRRHPPAPFSLWRFTTTEMEIGDLTVPARSPVLVDIEGINTERTSADGPDLTFGAGPHYCTGAHLAQLELRVLVAVMREDFPDACLNIPFSTLRHTRGRGITGSRLMTLPVRLRG
jgi:cytochrome P450